MKAAKGVSNMVLAHEIAVDKNFKLEKFEPPDNSVEKQVRQGNSLSFFLYVGVYLNTPRFYISKTDD